VAHLATMPPAASNLLQFKLIGRSIQAGKPSRHVMCARFVAVGTFCPHIVANFVIIDVEDTVATM